MMINQQSIQYIHKKSNYYQLQEVNEKVDHILVENYYTARTSIIENIQHIGRKLKKAEKKSEIVDNLLSSMYN